MVLVDMPSSVAISRIDPPARCAAHTASCSSARADPLARCAVRNRSRSDSGSSPEIADSPTDRARRIRRQQLRSLPRPVGLFDPRHDRVPDRLPAGQYQMREELAGEVDDAGLYLAERLSEARAVTELIWRFVVGHLVRAATRHVRHDRKGLRCYLRIGSSTFPMCRGGRPSAVCGG